ncbi:MAG TPA: nucleotide exchange factor GrpE [Candidatus Paceibacterota bacterium]|nr:nucleotide exchange factor GrpE [Candidatus Paceibacterota bacterium]
MSEHDDDVRIEADDPEAEEKAEGKTEKLREELAACRTEKQEYMDGWQRAKADYVNLLKRGNEEITRAEHNGISKAVEELLPAFDALERAKEHAELPDGFAAIAKQLEGAFKKLGLDNVEAEVGQIFDPVLHEAYGTDAVNDQAMDGQITAVLEKGWRTKTKVIRPARVRVAQHQ